jgi:nucleoside-diphosphate-sugar epimerase
MDNKTILVTGGAGYLGSVLVPQLLQAGQRVIVLDRFFFGDQDLTALDGAELRTGDIRSVEAKDFEGVDIVIDLAGLSNDPTCDLDPRLTTEINHHGSVRVAKKAAEAGVDRYILSSSCSVYGHTRDILDEQSEKRPLSRYAEAKLAAEQDILDLAEKNPGTCFTFLRNPTLFGMSERMRFDLVVNIMTLHAYSKRKVTVMGTGKHWRPLLHVADVSRAFCLVAQAERELVDGQIFNVGDDELNYRIVTIAFKVKTVLPETHIEMLNDDPERRDYRVSFKKFKDALGFTAEHGVGDGVRDIVEALEAGRIIPDDLRWYTLKYYRYLLEAERLYKKLNMDGKIL